MELRLDGFVADSDKSTRFDQPWTSSFASFWKLHELVDIVEKAH
jgi:hypothetical protein